MFWMKACRKCRGDLYQNEDPYGTYIACIQCSTYLTPAEEAQLLVSSTDQSNRFNYLVRVEALAA